MPIITRKIVFISSNKEIEYPDFFGTIYLYDELLMLIKWKG